MAAALLLGLALTACGASPTATGSTSKLKIAFGYPGPVGDSGWNHRHDVGRQDLIKALGGKIETTYVENVPYTEQMTQIYSQFVAQGYKMLVDDTSGGDLFRKVCAAHPDLSCVTTDATPPLGSNVIGVYPKDWQVGYLIGVAAGLLTKSGVVGYISGFSTPPIIANANAMALGCQSVRPKCSLRVAFLDSWYDPKKATEIANSMIDVGADFVYNTADSISAIAVAQKRGVWAAGTYDSGRSAGPNAYVTSDIWNWGPTYIKLVDSVLKGDFKGGQAIYPGIEDNGLYLDDWGPKVPDNVKQGVATAITNMKAGKNPFVGPIYDQSGQVKVASGEVMKDAFLYSGWKWFVQGVVSQAK